MGALQPDLGFYVFHIPHPYITRKYGVVLEIGGHYVNDSLSLLLSWL